MLTAAEVLLKHTTILSDGTKICPHESRIAAMEEYAELKIEQQIQGYLNEKVTSTRLQDIAAVISGEDTYSIIARQCLVKLIKEYTYKMIKEQLKVAANEAVLYSDWDYYNGEKEVSIDGDRGSVTFEVDKDSILNCTKIELK